jgi:hypothetical protein
MSNDFFILISFALLLSLIITAISYIFGKPKVRMHHKTAIKAGEPGPLIQSSLKIQGLGSENQNLPVPFQVSPHPRDFKGRKEEIQEILSDLKKREAIIALRGMPGIGKTALALILASKIKGQFPDGQLFMDMNGTSRSPLSPKDAMAQVIRSYQGIESPLPKDQSSLKGLYFSILSGKKILIVLDNVSNPEQIEPMLPPLGSSFIITSRSKFALGGSKERDLDVLPLKDAVELIEEISGRTNKQDSELAHLCGCLPLALRNAASALKERPDMDMAEYITKLADSRKRLELVEASFSLSYELLDEKLQKQWCLLSIFPADFDSGAISVIWDEKNVEDSLGELIKRSLVSRQICNVG